MPSGPRLGRAHIGCSGWAYDDWRGVIYPEGLPKRSWFDHYATLFDTVELNATFYRMPAPATFEKWAAAAPDGFIYSLKLGQFCTHRMKLKDPAGWLPNHVERVRLLGPHAGPTLVQLPPRWRRNADRLEEFLQHGPADLRCAVELRDSSWLADDVYGVLERHGAALCVHDLLPDHPRLLTTDWTFVRFHGPDAIRRPYHGRYGSEALEPAAEEMVGWLAHGHDVYAYFNNDWHGAAVADAGWLADRLGEADPPALGRTRGRTGTLTP